MKLTDRVRLYVRLQLPSGQVVPYIPFDDERPVSDWISQVFDGSRHTVFDVWLSPIGTKWHPEACERASVQFANCVVDYLSDRDPASWPFDMIAFVGRYRTAAERLDDLRRQHEAEIAAGPWRTPTHPDCGARYE